MPRHETRKRSTHGWAEVSRQRKHEMIQAIASGRATAGPAHAELDLTDRCNVACYFCNQQDTRSRSQIPATKALELIDELAAGGLRSVRLSGGGDPLFHSDIIAVFDQLAANDVVVDNLTTNGVALGPEIAQRLIEGRAREVIISLNGADGSDYHRMMKVRPDHFEKVVENVRHLIERRGDATFPFLLVQFLVDRQNLDRMPEMYELGAALGPDRIAINSVQQIAHERVGGEHLLTEADLDRARPLIEKLLRRDRDAGLLQLGFPVTGWPEAIEQTRVSVGHDAVEVFPTATTFKEENGGCFFSWYSTTITGNGNLHPCCILIQPGIEPLGQVNDSSFREQWTGPKFQRMREEQLQVLLAGNDAEWDPSRYEVLKEPCVRPHACWLKNTYFRGDEDFYRELGAALDAAR